MVFRMLSSAGARYGSRRKEKKVVEIGRRVSDGLNTEVRPFMNKTLYLWAYNMCRRNEKKKKHHVPNQIIANMSRYAQNRCTTYYQTHTAPGKPPLEFGIVYQFPVQRSFLSNQIHAHPKATPKKPQHEPHETRTQPQSPSPPSQPR